MPSCTSGAGRTTPLYSATWSSGYTAYLDAAALRQGLAVAENPRQVLTAYLTEGVVAGVIQDRAGIVQALEEVGLTVPRQGEHYLTAQDPETGEKWRLKGVLYERDFEGHGACGPSCGSGSRRRSRRSSSRP